MVYLVGGCATHMKNMLVKWDHFSKDRGEKAQKSFKPPPSPSILQSCIHLMWIYSQIPEISPVIKGGVFFTTIFRKKNQDWQSWVSCSLTKLYHVPGTLCYLPCIDVKKGPGTTRLFYAPRCRQLPNRNARLDQFRGKDTTMTFTSFITAVQRCFPRPIHIHPQPERRWLSIVRACKLLKPYFRWLPQRC